MRTISMCRPLAPCGLRTDQGYRRERECRYMIDGEVCTCGPYCECTHCTARNAFERLETRPRNCCDLLEGLTPGSLIIPRPIFIQPSRDESTRRSRRWEPMPGSVRLIRIQRGIAITLKLLSEHFGKTNQTSI